VASLSQSLAACGGGLPARAATAPGGAARAAPAAGQARTHSAPVITARPLAPHRLIRVAHACKVQCRMIAKSFQDDPAW